MGHRLEQCPLPASRMFARSVLLVLITGCVAGLRAMPDPQTAPSSTASNALSVAGGPDGGTVHSLAVVATRPVVVLES